MRMMMKCGGGRKRSLERWQSVTDFAQAVFDRTPPFSLEAETAVLGALLIAKDAVPRVLPIVREMDFYREQNRRLFRASVACWERGEALDVVTISEQLKRTGELEPAGGYDYLSSLVDAVPTAANVEYHARIISEKAVMRRVVESATVVIRTVYENGEGGLGAVAAAIDRVGAALEGYQAGDFTWLKESLWATFEHIELLQESKGGLTGVPSGFPDLDRMTCGFQGGDLVVVAARPSVGKTAWCLDVLRNASIGHGIPSALVSLEMAKKALTMRLLSQEGRVDMQRVRRGILSQDDHQRLAVAAGHLNTAPIYIDDHPDGTVSEVRAKIIRLHQRVGTRLVVVDYLQLMRGAGEENRRHEIDGITRGLKGLAMKLDIPIVLLSQLTRGLETRTNKRPTLSDLRESGGIEQDADLVMFLYRAEMYVQDGDGTKGRNDAVAKRAELEGKTELILAKQRNGPTGMVPLYFQKAYTRFDSVAQDPTTTTTEG
jgi:replicative DNA helicase